MLRNIIKVCSVITGYRHQILLKQRTSSILFDRSSSAVILCVTVLLSNNRNYSDNNNMEDKTNLKDRLTPLQYHVTQEAGTERPFTGCYNKVYDEGMYVCVVCKQNLFSSKTKYDSGCGWPAFNDVLDKGKVTLHKDSSAGMVRTEVRCSKCAAHLGHVFDDGPAPTRKRFCINSASLDFIPAKDVKET